MRKTTVLLGVSVALALWATPLTGARADEGMWTFNEFPSDRVARSLKVQTPQRWLDHVRLSSVRLAGGCSGSFVSKDGLVMTNHHCAHSCIQQLSTKEKDFVKSGFYARTSGDEVKCPEIELNNLVEIRDVTERVQKAGQGKPPEQANKAQKAEMSRLEKECATSDTLRCDVVTLYHGGAFNLYKYKRYQDVRLVFAPELSIAFFGGDPDNFNFPRYDLDVSFVRAYENGQPARVANHLAWSKTGPREGEATFVSGHPGGTSRQLTIAELTYLRDVALPDELLRLAELRGVITEFARGNPERARISGSELFSIENRYKALKGRWGALVDTTFFASKVREEQTLRAQAGQKPEVWAKVGRSWEAIARAQGDLVNFRNAFNYLERGRGFQSDLFDLALRLVRAADELKKPNGVRFREFSEGNLPAIKQRLFSSAPIYDDLEIVNLTHSLTKLREVLGADDPFVNRVLGKKSPGELAAEVIKGSRLRDVAVRKQLFEGGKAAIAASRDPMIRLARLVDPEARAVRKRYEDRVESVVKQNHELLAAARFAVQGRTTYPDATFTLRLSYGKVEGFPEGGAYVKPFTTLAGAFKRHTGRPPFDLPDSWLKAERKLDLKVPFNFTTTNDIIGGNSGSPVVSAQGEVVGLVFDGNIHSLGGDYGFDLRVNRTVAVHSEALIHTLDRVYGARRIVEELRPTRHAQR